MLNKCVKNEPIVNNFGTQNPEETWHQKVLNLPISSVNICLWIT